MGSPSKTLVVLFHGPRLADQQREVWARSLDSSFQHILRRYGGTPAKKRKGRLVTWPMAKTAYSKLFLGLHIFTSENKPFKVQTFISGSRTAK